MSTNPISEELLPCPFCGGDEIGNTGKHSLAFVCMTCEARGPAIDGDTEQASTWGEATAAWNRRAAGRAIDGVTLPALPKPGFYHYDFLGVDMGVPAYTEDQMRTNALAALPRAEGQEPVADLEARAVRLRLRIQELRIDHPEAAERRRDELAKLEADIAARRSAPSASPAQEPVAWLVEWTRDGEEWVDAHADEPRAVDQARKQNGTCTPLYRSALVKAPAPSTSFQMLMAAYVRGNAWAHENGLNADGLEKAAYDYADKMTATSQPQAKGEGE